MLICKSSSNFASCICCQLMSIGGSITQRREFHRCRVIKSFRTRHSGKTMVANYAIFFIEAQTSPDWFGPSFSKPVFNQLLSNITFFVIYRLRIKPFYFNVRRLFFEVHVYSAHLLPEKRQASIP